MILVISTDGVSHTVLLANVLQISQPPKAYRKKTDTIDTKRLLNEFVCGRLPLAFGPPRSWRELRRLVALRESLVSRRTALRNWVGRYLAHETWLDRSGLWSAAGMRRLRSIAAGLSEMDAMIWSVKLDEVEHLASLLKRVEAEILAVHKDWLPAQRLDEIYGIAVVSAVSILARIGPIERFASAEQLIGFAGLAPGVHQSDGTRRYGRIGGSGTDKQLRHYIIEATLWARHIPRYQATYQRACARTRC